MQKRVLTLLGASLIVTAIHAAHATDLWQVYQQAQKSAPVLQNYSATKDGAFQGYYAARAVLLPQLDANASVTGHWYSTSGYAGTYNQEAVGLGLTQSIIDLNSWGTTLEAKRTADAAQAQYYDNLSQFVLTVSKDYFTILYDQDQIAADAAAVKFYQRTLKQTEQKFHVGLSTSPAVKKAKANLYLGQATLIKDKSQLQIDISELAKLTNKRYSDLARLKSNFPFVMPNPDQYSAWVKQATKGNYNLQYQRLLASAQRANVAAQIGNQMPTVSLVGNYGFSKNNASGAALAAAGSSTYQPDWSVALQLNWNIFQGGTLFAQSIQAAHQYESADQASIETYRQVVASTRQDYRSVVSDIASVKALTQAVKSDQLALDQLEEKYKVGTETIKNVLDQARKLFSDRKLLANAQYQYITDLLTLHYDAGSLTPSNLKALNTWLIPPVQKS